MSAHPVEEALVRAAVGVLRPIVRRMLRSGVPFGRLENAVRDLFVEVAEETFEPGERITDSRVSLVTGLNRKEVKRIRAAGASPSTGGSTAFGRRQVAGLVSRWLADPEMTDGRGRPKPIPYQADEGPSFVALARATTVDVSPRSLLDELERTGAARADGDRVALVTDAYVPREAPEELFAMLRSDPAELVETMCFNVFEAEEGQRLLQRKVAYDNLGAEGLARLRTRLREEAERFLRKADREISKSDHDRNPKAAGGARCAAGIGVYYFERSTGSRGGAPVGGSDDDA